MRGRTVTLQVETLFHIKAMSYVTFRVTFNTDLEHNDLFPRKVA